MTYDSWFILVDICLISQWLNLQSAQHSDFLYSPKLNLEMTFIFFISFSNASKNDK